MKKVIFISSVGGHLTQLLQLKSLYEKYDYLLVTEKTKVTNNLKTKYNCKYLFHASRKSLNIIIFPFIIVLNTIKSLYLLIKYKPQIIVSTGTNTAVPMCYLGKLVGIKIIFIETFAKNNSQTLSGRLVYPIADKFIVQWKTMLKVYPNAEYWGPIY